MRGWSLPGAESVAEHGVEGRGVVEVEFHRLGFVDAGD
jgi:hypothetical protein